MSNIVPGRFCWQELATPDPEKALAFYNALFGWTHEEKQMGNGCSYYLLKLDGKELGGMYKLEGPMFEGVPPHWLAYVKSADVDATAAKVTEHGGTLMMPPMDVPDVGRMVMFTDPQGAGLAAFQDGTKCGTELGEKDNHAFCWSELMTSDRQAAISFYTKVFGWSTEDSDMGEMGTYTLWMQAGEHTGGCMEINEHMGPVPPHWLNYVIVEDVNVSLAKAVELGAETIVPVMPIPDVGQFTLICDPTGAHICLFEHDPAAVEAGDCSATTE